MNYREKMRKAIECPQFGNINYGEWGTLNLNQRKDIKRLLDEMDRADEVIKNQYFEIDKVNNVISELEKEIDWLLERQYESERFAKEQGFDTYLPAKVNLEHLKNKLKELKEKE